MTAIELTDWDTRSPVLATMLNPALIATVIAGSAEEFERISHRPMPWEYVFIVLPLVLHRGTREALPKDIRTHLPKWVADHPLLQAGFPERARAMAPHVREGLRYALREGLVKVDDQGQLRGSIPVKKKAASIGDIQSIVLAAGLVGRWLTKAERSSTVFAMFGVAP